MSRTHLLHPMRGLERRERTLPHRGCQYKSSLLALAGRRQEFYVEGVRRTSRYYVDLPFLAVMAMRLHTLTFFDGKALLGCLLVYTSLALSGDVHNVYVLILKPHFEVTIQVNSTLLNIVQDWPRYDGCIVFSNAERRFRGVGLSATHDSGSPG